MSWLEGETDVLEKLHGALTEVGLPACGAQNTNITTRVTTALRNKQEQTLFLVLPGLQCLSFIFTERKKAHHASIHGPTKRKSTTLAMLVKCA